MVSDSELFAVVFTASLLWCLVIVCCMYCITKFYNLCTEPRVELATPVDDVPLDTEVFAMDGTLL